MSVCLIFAACGLLALIACMLWGAKLYLNVKLRSTFCKILVRLRIFYIFVPIRIRLCIYYDAGTGLSIASYRANGSIKRRSIIGEAGAKRRPAAERITGRVSEFADIKYLEISGEIGVKNDSFKSVMFCGFAMNLLSAALPFFLKQNDFPGGINIFPCFSRPAFSLNLEGIAHIKPLKLIKTAIEEKGDKTYAAIDRKPDEHIDGTN